MNCLVVICNVPDETTATHMAHVLVQEQLAACVNILPACRSVYRWEGRLEEAGEIPLLIKTTVQAYPPLQQRLLELHPYDVPEIIALPVQHGLPAYLTWVSQSLLSSDGLQGG
ncbi:MAG: divalent-cation tolerance protein CutA [Aquitalea sp.]|nr:divalent-cation tolerance protein CutA [Aquitalea sp.]